jgi:hypothetical protein
MSAFDAVDGAHSAASKCNTGLKRGAIQGGEGTADSGIDDMELKVLTNWRGHDDVMQIRSIRGSGEPVWVNASLNACFSCQGAVICPAERPLPLYLILLQLNLTFEAYGNAKGSVPGKRIRQF